jgi:D-beta-D-heptose 7-phosphate kinase/D-beta-D-heptose 1-phosphate adenosyltransferase
MKTIFVNGTFDILHRGHLEMINWAKSLGDYLIIGIDSDSRVKQLKGESRPINSVEDRKFMLLNLKSVDEVKVFDSDLELKQMIQSIKPDIMVVGSDWKEKSVIGSYYSSQLLFYDRLEEYSTTGIITKIRS